MGGFLGKNRANKNDPFYNPALPPRAGPPGVGPPGVGPPGLGPPGVGPRGGLGPNNPYQEYGYEYESTLTLENYGQPIKPRIDPYGGRYAQGEFQ